MAFQGELGAYSEAAIAQQFSGYEPIPCRTFRDVVARVLMGGADYGCLPLENSTTGRIAESQGLLREFAHEISVCAEVRLRVRHCLLGVPGSSLEKIRVIYSHPQALAQCREFLEGLHVSLEGFYDTAGAARFVAEHGDLTCAAIASHEAAHRYQLTILREGIESDPTNTTRFVVFHKASP
ncbi:MAG: prephenate dehydratase domain-containing protein [Candidatus Bipolaricaulia bacterium]